MRAAALDIGTNSTRLLIADYTDNNFEILDQDMVITRLGQGVDDSRLLNNKAMERTLTVLKEYSDRIERYNVDDIKVVGTSALRDVENSDYFIALVKEKTGLELEVISGREEAGFIYNGAKTDIEEDDFLIIDIGGGSTEFIWQNKSKVKEISLNIGAVRLTERYIEKSVTPLPADSLSLLKDIVSEEIKKSIVKDIKAQKIIGVGGTITTLAAMDLKLESYDREKIHHYSLGKKRIDIISNLLISSDLEERKNMAGLKSARADIITAGTVILQKIMERLNFTEITISERDILFGMLDGIIRK